MATLVLGGLGAALGGGIGGLLGTFVGQTIDANVLGSGRSGRARLADLSFQSSSYGAQLPRIYGTMRVAGAVVWATDLTATVSTGGGKAASAGGGYSYSANFAVALSSRAASRVRRIWADGKLLRGESGDWKVATKFRFYQGDEDQGIDPLIASFEGIDNTPAYRGIALAVFEQLQLIEFGNRIPVLTFELVADDAEPTVRTILSDLSHGSIVGGAEHVLAGFAGYGATLGDAVAPLLELEQGQLATVADCLSAAVSDDLRAVADHELGCGSDTAAARKLVRRKSSADLPTSCSVRYYDASLDYQAGEQQAVWSTVKREGRRLELPAVLTATSAKTLAHNHLTQIWDQRETAEFRLPVRYAGARVGERLAFAKDGEWRITGRVLENLVVRLECRRLPSPLVQMEADAGRSVAAIDKAAEPSDIVLLDLPAMNELAGEPFVSVAVSGGQHPWRPVPMSVAAEGMPSLDLVAPTRAVVGWARSVLPPGSEALFDQANSVVVELRDEDWLQSCTIEELLGGANQASLGAELMQFARVEPLGKGRYRLSHLLRGRYGTEWAMRAHEHGERFALLRSSNLTRAVVPQAAIGRSLAAVGAGLGDGAAPGSAQISFNAESLRPPAPCHLRYARSNTGGLEVTWVRRSRVGYGWNDFVDAPLAEESERYLVSLAGSGGSLTREVGEQRCAFGSAELAALGSYPVQISVVQLGTFAPSRPVFVNVEEHS